MTENVPSTTQRILVREWRVYPVIRAASELKTVWNNATKQ